MPRSKRYTINLTADEIALLDAAFETYISEQLADEDPDAIPAAERLHERVSAWTPGPQRIAASVAHECAEALDAHLYWEVSDPQDRNDGFVFWNPEEDEPGSKMARDDRSPEYVEECRTVDTLRARFEALS